MKQNKHSLKCKKKKTHRLYENLRYTKDQGSRDLLQLVFIDLKRREETRRERVRETKELALSVCVKKIAPMIPRKRVERDRKN